MAADDSPDNILTKNGKIKRTSNDVVIPELSDELKYRKANPITDVVEAYSSKLSCSACGNDLISQIKAGDKITKHPCLRVLTCQKCVDFYNSGAFSVDSEEEEKYCRWCGEGGGGVLFLCSKCICGFCAKCIKLNFGSRAVKEIEDDEDWLCLLCDPKPLWHLRNVTHAASEHVKNLQRKRIEIRKERFQNMSKQRENRLKTKQPVWENLPNLPDDAASSAKRRRIMELEEDRQSSISENSPLNTSYSQTPSPNLSDMSFETNSTIIRKKSKEYSELNDKDFDSTESRSPVQNNSSAPINDKGNADENTELEAICDTIDASTNENPPVDMDGCKASEAVLKTGKLANVSPSDAIRHVLKVTHAYSSLVKGKALQHMLLCNNTNVDANMERQCLQKYVKLLQLVLELMQSSLVKSEPVGNDD